MTALAFLVVQQLEGHLVLPLVMSQAVHLPPAVVAVGCFLMGQLFGVLGLFVAVPVLVLVLAMILVEELWVLPREAAHREASQDRSPVARALRVP